MRTLLIALVTAGLAAPAAADTIWLSNGRVLQVDDARIENGSVVFRTHGVQVTMPADFVQRIRRDDGLAPQAVPRADRPRRLDSRSLRRPARRTAVPRAPARLASPEPREFYYDPADRDYWQDRLSWVQDQISSLEARRARTSNRGRVSDGDRYAGSVARRLELQAWRALESALHTEARRLGVPPDWLRVDGRLGD